MSINFREKMKKHLEIKDKFQRAAIDVINEKYTIKEAAKHYEVKLDDLKHKVYLIREKQNFRRLKSIFESAVHDRLIKKKKRKEIAERYNIRSNILLKELHIAQKKEKYEYNRHIREPKIFTYQEEMSLIKQLQEWKDSQISQICTCEICVMQQLLNLTNEAIKHKTTSHKKRYYDNVGEISWLIDFEMTYNDDMSNLLIKCNCTRDFRNNQEEPSTSKSSDSCRYMNQMKELGTSKFSDSCRYMNQMEEPDISKFSDSCRNMNQMEEPGTTKFREEIKKHLKIKDNLQRAAICVIKKECTIEQAAKFCEIELDYLKHKFKLIKIEKNFRLLKFQFESAVNDCLTNKHQIKEIAEKYNIDAFALSGEVLIAQSKKEKYEYNKYFRVPQIFTYQEEMSLIKQLRKWKYSQISQICTCEICVMQQLLNLINEAIKHKSTPCKKSYDTVGEISWLIDFEITYHNDMSDLLIKRNCKRDFRNNQEKPGTSKSSDSCRNMNRMEEPGTNKSSD